MFDWRPETVGLEALLNLLRDQAEGLVDFIAIHKGEFEMNLKQIRTWQTNLKKLQGNFFLSLRRLRFLEFEMF